MKKLLIITLLLFISGCEKEVETPIVENEVEPVEEVQEVDNDLEEEVVEELIEEPEEEGIVQEKYMMYFYPKGDIHYDNRPSFVDTYYLNENKEFTYLKVKDAVKAISKLHEDSMEWTYENNTIYCNDFPDNNSVERVSFYVELDSENNNLIVSNTLMFGTMNHYKESHAGIEFESNEFNEEILIDLDKYSLRIVEEDGDIYMPLQFMNLLTFNMGITFYESAYDIYFFDRGYDTSILVDQFQEYGIGYGADEEQLYDNTEESVGMLSLYLDYFYGLDFSEYQKEVDDLKKEILSEEIGFLRGLEYMIVALNDIHNGILFGGYNNVNYSIGLTVEDFKGTDFERFFRSKSANGYTNENKFDYVETEDTLYIEISTFSYDYRDELWKLLDEVPKEKENIIIDIRRNTGGRLSLMRDVLKHFTYDDLFFEVNNGYSDQYWTMSYVNNTKDKFVYDNLYVVTSASTFSAGNAFASYLNDYMDAVIVGDKTSGGAFPIAILALPNGVIMQISGIDELLGKDRISIEDGIEPDYYIDAVERFAIDTLIEHVVTSYN